MSKNMTPVKKSTTKMPLAPSSKGERIPGREKTTAGAPKNKNTQRAPNYSVPMKGK